MRSRVGGMVALVLAMGACDCREKSDEERLRERVDTTSVHLWVATKVAVTKVQSDDPDVQQAREQLLALVAAYQRVQRGANGTAGTPSAATGATPTAPSAATPAPEPRLEPAAAVDLAVALWDLRATGARIVREDREDELDPVLPVLLANHAGMDPALMARIDGNTEHALLLWGLFALKLHPRSPTPVAPEILLYEAVHVDADEVGIPGLGEPTRAIRSYLYAQEAFCDLAQRDAEALDEGDLQHLAELFAATGGEALEPTEIERTAGALRGLAHGSTALCYLKRDDQEKADEELQRFVDSAEQGGAAPADLAMIRAYLAYRRDDLAETRAQLALAKTSPWVDDEERARLDALIAQLDREETSGVDGLFDRAFVGGILVQVTWHELEEAGVFDALADAPLFQGVRAFVGGATGAVRAASETVDQAGQAAEDTASEALEGGRSWVEGLLGD